MQHDFESIPGWANLRMQGELIKILISRLGVASKLTIAEVGVYMGRGTSLWNVELLNANVDYAYYAIDHFNGSSEHIKSDTIPDYERALEYIKPYSKVKVLRAESIEASKTFTDGFFDIVYIDASHEYEYVKQDILAWLPKVRKGGYLCGDDYSPVWKGVIQAVNEVLMNVEIIGETQWLVEV